MISPSTYVTDLDSVTETLPSHVTTKCMTLYSTSLNDTFPIRLYAKNLSSIRSVAYHRKRYVRVVVDWRQEVTFACEDYGKSRVMPSSTSDLETQTRTPTSMNPCISSWIVGRRNIRIITVSTATNNGSFFSVCPFSEWRAREGGSSCTHGFESTCGVKTQGAHFTRMWLGQQIDFNFGHEVVLLHALQILPPQSPAGPGSGLVLSIRLPIGAINCAP